MERYLIDVRTWKVFKLEFNDNKELVDLDSNVAFELTEQDKKNSLYWSRTQLGGKALVEANPNMSLITPSYMLYNTEDNKLKFIQLIRKGK